MPADELVGDWLLVNRWFVWERFLGGWLRRERHFLERICGGRYRREFRGKRRFRERFRGEWFRGEWFRGER
ncbi:MAG TPA: hypothetical protein VMV08_10510 [Gaiellaceae bacterium]|nr:hypothetical protein [Gaiellaceae bacterium]